MNPVMKTCEKLSVFQRVVLTISYFLAKLCLEKRFVFSRVFITGPSYFKHKRFTPLFFSKCSVDPKPRYELANIFVFFNICRALCVCVWGEPGRFSFPNCFLIQTYVIVLYIDEGEGRAARDQAKITKV